MMMLSEGLRSTWDDDAPRPMHRDLRAVLSTKAAVARRDEQDKQQLRGNPNPLFAVRPMLKLCIISSE